MSEPVLEQLEKEIGDKSWSGSYWGRNGALALARQRAAILTGDYDIHARGILSPLASTYYSATGNAWKRQEKAGWRKPFWIFRAVWCFHRAAVLSDRLVKAVGGIKNLRSAELDVRCSILRKRGRRWLKEALACALIGLESNPSVESECLLKVGAGECYERMGNKITARFLFRQALALEKEMPPGTRARLWRAWADYLERQGENDEAHLARANARVIARQADLADQVLKAGDCII